MKAGRPFQARKYAGPTGWFDRLIFVWLLVYDSNGVERPNQRHFHLLRFRWVRRSLKTTKLNSFWLALFLSTKLRIPEELHCALPSTNGIMNTSYPADAYTNAGYSWWSWHWRQTDMNCNRNGNVALELLMVANIIVIIKLPRKFYFHSFLGVVVLLKSWERAKKSIPL